jgi:glycosyltransferase involved in cell wall biosynthesis
MSKKEKEYINIFYGSGTLAHNSDFIDLTLGAVETILKENENVKLTIAGHLTLPESFRKEFEEQIILLKKTSTIDHYWSYLSGADINLAVLHNDVINNCKSELKWFEAACFKIPSVVSNTQNYMDIIDNGEDAIIASTTEEWYEALDRLVKDKELRDKIGEAAYRKVRKNYSLEALSKNIDRIIKDVLAERTEDA